jgi:serine-type D-Ala-D-Ala carboxypeptidase (penicillin-binding protein 5/6)
MLQTMLRVMLFIFFAISVAQANPIIPVPTQPQMVVTPSAPVINAKGYIVLDVNSGKIIVEKNADERMAPASLTKLMSMYIISAALKNGTIHLDDKVRISENAWRTGGSRMFVKVNDEVSVKELIHGIVIASGNDATVAMAEHIAGSEDAFASMMNTTAQSLGMKNTHFVDSNGLPSPNHYSTPRDLAILAKAIIQNYPEDYKLYSEKWFTYNGIRQPNRNRLLWRYQLADGLKTGHTDDAGFCLVSSAVKDGTRFISVVMGAPSDTMRTESSIRLLSYSFRFFETHKVYKANTVVTQAHVWKGKKSDVALGVNDDFYVTLPPGQSKNIQAYVELRKGLHAPIIKGQPYGTLKITLNNQLVATQPLLALENDPKGGFIRGIMDSIHYGIHSLFSKSVEKANNA